MLQNTNIFTFRSNLIKMPFQWKKMGKLHLNSPVDLIREVYCVCN